MEQQAIHTVTELSQSLFVFFSIALILLSLPGFLCLEIGSIQKKNNMNAAIKAVVSVCVVFVVFFICSYSTMMGSTRLGGYVGEIAFFLNDIKAYDISSFLTYAALCCISIAIISGGIAERCKFLPFLLISLAMAILIFPVFGHWVWGGGWLDVKGFHDYAGAAVVHLTGASVALAGIRKLGARTSRLNQQGRLIENFSPDAPMYAFGIFLLIISWFGIVMALSDKAMTALPWILLNTLVAACFGGLVSLLSTWAYLGIANVIYLFRGIVAGLVAISATADIVSPQSAMIIGVLAGSVIPVTILLLDKLKWDDATGVVGAHGVAAIVGLLSVPLFIEHEALELLNKNLEQPLTLQTLFVTQCLGVVACLLWSYITGALIWKLLHSITIFYLRPDEIKIGLNYTEHMTTEPLYDLNTAVDLVRKEQVLEAKTHFDRLENSDLEGLSAALRELLNREHRDM